MLTIFGTNQFRRPGVACGSAHPYIISEHIRTISYQNAMDIFSLPTTEVEAVAFLQQHGILPMQHLCPNGQATKLSFCNNNIFWRCHVNKCQKKVSLRKDTWFLNSRLSFVTAVRFIYGWASESTSIKWCKKELRMTHSIIVDCNA